MRLSKKINYFQQGGPMEAPTGPVAAAPETAPEATPEAGSQEEMMAQVQQMGAQLANMLMQQVGDPQIAMMILQAAEAALQGAGEQLPPEEQQPVYQRHGGSIVRIR